MTDDDTGADDGEGGGGGGAAPPSYTPPPACQLGAEAGLEEAPKTCQVPLPWTDGCIIGGCHKLRVLLIFSNLIKLKVLKSIKSKLIMILIENYYKFKIKAKVKVKLRSVCSDVHHSAVKGLNTDAIFTGKEKVEDWQ